MKFKQKEKGWVINSERPEEIHIYPEKYYTEEEIERYSRSGGINRTQRAIAYRIIQLLGMDKGEILDLGCGPGFTTEVYSELGFNVIGLDKIEKMLDKAREKKLNVVQGDMTEISKLFKKNQFDAVVSASALQWIKNKEDIEDVAKGAYKILKKNGKLVIQFYPKSQEEMMSTAKIFKKAGFEGQLILDNPENPMKRVIYIVMSKD